MASNTVSYIYEILDRYSAPLRRITQQTNRFRAATARAQRGATRLAGGMRRMGNSALSLRGALGAAGVAGAMWSVVRVSMDMEDAMADVARVTDLSASELNQFEGTLERMSEALVVAKRDLAVMAYEAGKLGVTIEDMPEYLTLTTHMQKAFDMPAEEVSRSVGEIRAMMGLTIEDTQTLTDSMNYLADNTSATGRRMIETIRRLSGTFSELEIPPEIAAGFAGFANQISVTDRLAASGFRMMVTRMRETAGMTTRLMADPVAAFTEELERLSGLTPEALTIEVADVYGAEAAPFVTAAVARIELFRSTMEKAASDNAVGSMEREFQNFLARSSTGFERLKIVATNTMQAIGDILKPAATRMAGWFTGLANSIRDFAEQHPGVVRLLGALGVGIIVFTGLAVAVGLLMIALAPVVGLLGAISLPMVAIAAGVAAAAIAFRQWTATSHPIIQKLRDIGASIAEILRPIGEMIRDWGILIGQMLGFEEGSSGFVQAIERIGYAFTALLTPIELAIQSISTLLELQNAVWDGATAMEVGDILERRGRQMHETLNEGGRNVRNAFTGNPITRGATMAGDIGGIVASEIIGGGYLGATVPAAAAGTNDLADAAIARWRDAPQDVNLEGDIRVSATPGTTVESAEISLPAGSNMVTQ